MMRCCSGVDVDKSSAPHVFLSSSWRIESSPVTNLILRDMNISLIHIYTYGLASRKALSQWSVREREEECDEMQDSVSELTEQWSGVESIMRASWHFFCQFLWKIMSKRRYTHTLTSEWFRHAFVKLHHHSQKSLQRPHTWFMFMALQRGFFEKQGQKKQQSSSFWLACNIKTSTETSGR